MSSQVIEIDIFSPAYWNLTVLYHFLSEQNSSVFKVDSDQISWKCCTNGVIAKYSSVFWNADNISHSQIIPSMTSQPPRENDPRPAVLSKSDFSAGNLQPEKEEIITR